MAGSIPEGGSPTTSNSVRIQHDCRRQKNPKVFLYISDTNGKTYWERVPLVPSSADLQIRARLSCV